MLYDVIKPIWELDRQTWSANENSRYYIDLCTTLYEPSVPRNQKTQSCQKLQPESSATYKNACLKIEYHGQIVT